MPYAGEEGAKRLVIEYEQECDAAMTQTGPVGTYDPNANTDNTVGIANEKQAALWMDCVETTSCANIEKGFCEPHY